MHVCTCAYSHVYGVLANADGLYLQLQEQKRVEKEFWLSKWWHQRRPERRKIEIVEPVCRQVALTLTLTKPNPNQDRDRRAALAAGSPDPEPEP